MSNPILAAALIAICDVESGGKTNAINQNDGGTASYGVCQIKYATAKQLGFRGTVSELWLNPDTNRYWAGKYLEKQYNRYKGDILKAISAYNCGRACNNKGYVRKVLSKWISNPETWSLLPKALKNVTPGYTIITQVGP